VRSLRLVSRASVQDSLCADVLDGLERVGLPAYLVDRHGRIQWINAAASSMFGDVRGRLLSSLAAPDHVQRSREQLARKIVGGRSRTDFEIDVIDRSGSRTAMSISSVPVRHGRDVVGVFGVATPSGRRREAAHAAEAELEPSLTPRQREVLTLLADGASTEEIATTLALSEETVRNHIRQLLRRLGVHSRLAAVAYARRHRLL
jgi:PAS domain S-box-containing protein